MVSESGTLADLREQLAGDSLKRQLSAVHELVARGEAGTDILKATLLERQHQPPTILDGRMVQMLYATQQEDLQTFLAHHWPQGRFPMPSERGIDYGPLQHCLVAQDFQEADRLTLVKLCELAGPTAVRRKWVYFTEVDQFPSLDLQTLDRLWLAYSEGKFGFSVQRRLWLSLGQNWDKLWPRLAWKEDNIWTRYPSGFIWDLSAPDGHLPLSNQLRGVRMLAALLAHPAWQEDS
ncbi:MAG TPA: GUN4 N-terminal ARM-like repeat domain-containing protein [Leptolyngbyaceae cyanobacterium M65_K2018_010]|nr:GUN4 N-terminal ARM-like repeat domain-containing protein [Leptolyngbyaceae cyanobacterium M65_K2018_010]